MGRVEGTLEKGADAPVWNGGRPEEEGVLKGPFGRVCSRWGVWYIC